MTREQKCREEISRLYHEECRAHARTQAELRRLSVELTEAKKKLKGLRVITRDKPTPGDPAAVALGRKGGKTRVSKGPLANKTPEERAEWARKMAAARVAKKGTK